MSYILDALKKSDQERQQGNSPHLHSTHGPLLQSRPSSPPFKSSAFWLVSGGVLVFCTCLVVLFFQFHSFLSEKNMVETTDTGKTQQKPAAEQAATGKPVMKTTSEPRVTVKEQDKVVLSIPVRGTPAEPPAHIQAGTQLSSPPYLKDLSGTLQGEIPTFNFAGHTYSTNPAQRIIIANGKIVREGDVIAPDTYLREITWEGVILEYKGSLFRIDTD